LLSKPLFDLGTVVCTIGVIELMEKGLDVLPYIGKHVTGDWGTQSASDKRENDYSVNRNLRILSSYHTEFGKIWIITEADRSSTTILKPDEY
jgi:hypothetical protein